jgi:hypothetical protein
MLVNISNEELYFVLMNKVRRNILKGLQVGLEANLEIIPKMRDDANALEKYSLAYEKLRALHTYFNNLEGKKEALNIDKKYLKSEYMSTLQRYGVPARCISDLRFYSKLFKCDHNDPQCFLPITAEVTQEGLKLVCKLSVDDRWLMVDDSDSATTTPERVSSSSDHDTKSNGETEKPEDQGLRPYYG